ncbi:glutaredoxin 3 (plasmid) [Thioclava sp. 'Guangxiensis']|uniref:glutaredoxin 3 n=1 Tax=Thioclava sp. 'Guangxiensis' TaxID=3149044 RepID=UPI0032C4979F
MAKVEIYTTPFCGYCSRAKSILKSKKVAFREIDAVSREKRQKMIARAGGAHTVPQIFIGDIHIGGCSELMALERNGKLDQLLQLD